MVVVKEIVAVLGCWIFRVPDREKNMHDGPQNKDKDQVQQRLVESASEDDVLVELLIHQRRLLVKIPRNYGTFDALSCRPRQPL